MGHEANGSHKSLAGSGPVYCHKETRKKEGERVVTRKD